MSAPHWLDSYLSFLWGLPLSLCLKFRAPAYDLTNVGPFQAEHDERRRTPRFPCAGEAKIICLPSEGLFLPGRVRDLSLGGCCLESPLRLDHGARAEIVLRMNQAIFRAVGRVRAIRGRWALGMEFLQLSAGGREMLRDAVAHLARLQAYLDRVAAARREEQQKLLLREMESEGLRRCLVSGHIPLLGTGLFAESKEQSSPEAASPERSADDPGEDSAVDIFI